MDQCALKNARALILNNATVRATLLASPIWAALLESTSPLTQAHSNTTMQSPTCFNLILRVVNCKKGGLLRDRQSHHGLDVGHEHDHHQSDLSLIKRYTNILLTFCSGLPARVSARFAHASISLGGGGIFQSFNWRIQHVKVSSWALSRTLLTGLTEDLACLPFLTRSWRAWRGTQYSRAILLTFGFFSRLAASQASIVRDSADSAVLGMVGGRYGLEKCEVGECFQIGNSGVAHP